MKENIIKWLLDYDESIMSFVSYLIDEYKCPGKIFKTLLEICVENYELRDNAVKEIDKHFIKSTEYIQEITIYWSNLSTAARNLLIGFDSYPRIYGLLVFLQLHSNIHTPDTMRQYFDFIIYYDIIETTQSLDAMTVFSSFVKNINENLLIDFINKYVTDKLCSEMRICLHIPDNSLLLIDGFFDILKLNESDRFQLFKILSLDPTPLKCRIINKLHIKYNYNTEEIISFYHPLLLSDDKQILEQVVLFWDMAVNEIYANYIFKTLIDKAHIEDSIYCLLEKIALSFEITFEKKNFFLLKSDYKMMTHLFMFTIEILPEIFSLYFNSDFDKLIMKLIDYCFINLLPYINDILKKCQKNIGKSLEIIVKILKKFEEKDTKNISLEVLNMYYRFYQDEIENCKKKVLSFYETELQYLPLPEKINKIEILKDFQSENTIKDLYRKLNENTDDYIKYQINLEIFAYKNK